MKQRRCPWCGSLLYERDDKWVCSRHFNTACGYYDLKWKTITKKEPAECKATEKEENKKIEQTS